MAAAATPCFHGPLELRPVKVTEGLRQVAALLDLDSAPESAFSTDDVPGWYREAFLGRGGGW